MIPALSFSAWATIEAVSNHLWQSTLFAAAAGLLSLASRRNRAQVRYLALAGRIREVSHPVRGVGGSRRAVWLAVVGPDRGA